MKRIYTAALAAALFALPAQACFACILPTRAALPGEDPQATKLLKDARLARAEWNNFPGFKADISINHNGAIHNGTVTAHASGQVDLHIQDSEAKKWARRQLLSLVAHRLSSAGNRDTPCAFADDNQNHPLGRKIKVLNDELHSSYRIKDDQITEVNRTMKGGIRFTITVIENYVTPEKKFLPAYYVVNTWTQKSNQLVSSVSHLNSWKRIGKYDLPESLMIVTAKGRAAADTDANSTKGADAMPQVLDVWSIRFSNVRLLKK